MKSLHGFDGGDSAPGCLAMAEDIFLNEPLSLKELGVNAGYLDSLGIGELPFSVSELSTVTANLPTITTNGTLGPTANPSAGQGKAKRGPRPRLFKKYHCQADGCHADLATCSFYYQRNHICSQHLKAPSFFVSAVESRFCQRCGSSHQLTEFDGKRKSCRRSLEIHNNRRRARQAPDTGDASVADSNKATEEAGADLPRVKFESSFDPELAKEIEFLLQGTLDPILDIPPFLPNGGNIRNFERRSAAPEPALLQTAAITAPITSSFVTTNADAEGKYGRQNEERNEGRDQVSSAVQGEPWNDLYSSSGGISLDQKRMRSMNGDSVFVSGAPEFIVPGSVVIPGFLPDSMPTAAPYQISVAVPMSMMGGLRVANENGEQWVLVPSSMLTGVLAKQ